MSRARWLGPLSKALAMAFLLCVILTACGGGNASGSRSAPVSASSDSGEGATLSEQAFQGREARDASEMGEFVDEAVTQGVEANKSVTDDTEEGELNKSAEKAFKEANDAYESKDYASATDGYKDVLDEYSLHLGANVNLTLSLLQRNQSGDDEAALTQALKCCYLFPDDPGCLLNAQVAGVACGFGVEDVMKAIADVRKEAEGADVTVAELLAKSDDVQDSYDYNQLWDQIEIRLHDTRDVESYQYVRELYEELEKRVGDDDEDLIHLKAYLDAVGVQLGFVDDKGNPSKPESVDPAELEPTSTLPYTVADDLFCKFVIEDVTTDKEGYAVVVFEVTNKTGDHALLAIPSEWKVNGTVTIQPRENDGVVEELAKGKTVSGKMHFEGSTTYEGDIKSFVGEFAILDANDESELVRYPVSYQAE